MRCDHGDDDDDRVLLIALVVVLVVERVVSLARGLLSPCRVTLTEDESGAINGGG